MASALLLAAWGCVPARDNPYDPKNAPKARLDVVPADGRANEPFRIDASASTGGLDKRRYSYDLDGIEGYEYVPAVASSADSFEWTFDDLPRDAFGVFGSGLYVRDVGVRVESEGASDEARFRVTLRNTAPTLEVGQELIVAPWSGGLEIVLEPCGGVTPCPSGDDDGTAGVTWNWRQVPEDTIGLTLTSNGRVARFIAPEEPQTLYFEASVDDGFSKKLDTRVVRVGTAAWISMADPNRTFRFHPELAELRTIAGYDYYHPRGTFLEQNGVTWISQTFDNLMDPRLDTVFRLSREGDILGVWNLPATHIAGGQLVPTSDGGACLIAPDAFDGNINDFFRLQPIVSGTAGTLAQVTGGGGTAKNVFRIPGEIAGECRGVTDDGVLVIHADATTSTLFDIDLSESEDFADFPPDIYFPGDDGALWRWILTSTPDETLLSAVARYSTSGEMTLSADFTTEGESVALVPINETDVLLALRPPSGDLLVYEIRGSGEVEQVPFPELPLFQYAAGMLSLVEDRSIWVVNPIEESIRRLERTESGWEVTGILFGEELPTPCDNLYAFAPDRYVGGILVDCYAIAGDARKLVRVPAAGSAFEPVPASANNALDLAVSPLDGTAWTTTFGDFLRRIDFAARQIAVAPFPANSSFIDFFANRYGGAWMLVDPFDAGSPAKAVEIDQDGAFTGAEIAFPVEKDLVTIAIGSDGPQCAGQKDFFGIADLFVVSGTSFTQVATEDSNYIEAGADGGCWFMIFNGGYELLHSEPDGTLVSTPLASYGRWIPDPRASDGGVWVLEGANVRHLSPAGVFDAPITTLASPASANLPIRAQSLCPPADDTDDACVLLWFADGPYLRRIRGDGLELPAAILPFGQLEAVSLSD